MGLLEANTVKLIVSYLLLNWDAVEYLNSWEPDNKIKQNIYSIFCYTIIV